MQVLMISLLKWRSELHKVIKSNWIEGTSNGKPIYMNIHTGERQVKPPPELVRARCERCGTLAGVLALLHSWLGLLGSSLAFNK